MVKFVTRVIPGDQMAALKADSREHDRVMAAKRLDTEKTVGPEEERPQAKPDYKSKGRMGIRKMYFSHLRVTLQARPGGRPHA